MSAHQPSPTAGMRPICDLCDQPTAALVFHAAQPFTSVVVRRHGRSQAFACRCHAYRPQPGDALVQEIPYEREWFVCPTCAARIGAGAWPELTAARAAAEERRTRGRAPAALLGELAAMAAAALVDGFRLHHHAGAGQPAEVRPAGPDAYAVGPFPAPDDWPSVRREAGADGPRRGRQTIELGAAGRRMLLTAAGEPGWRRVAAVVGPALAEPACLSLVLQLAWLARFGTADLERVAALLWELATWQPEGRPASAAWALAEGWPERFAEARAPWRLAERLLTALEDWERLEPASAWRWSRWSTWWSGPSAIAQAGGAGDSPAWCLEPLGYRWTMLARLRRQLPQRPSDPGADERFARTLLRSREEETPRWVLDQALRSGPTAPPAWLTGLAPAIPRTNAPPPAAARARVAPLLAAIGDFVADQLARAERPPRLLGRALAVTPPPLALPGAPADLRRLLLEPVWRDGQGGLWVAVERVDGRPWACWWPARAAATDAPPASVPFEAWPWLVGVLAAIWRDVCAEVVLVAAPPAPARDAGRATPRRRGHRAAERRTTGLPPHQALLPSGRPQSATWGEPAERAAMLAAVTAGLRYRRLPAGWPGRVGRRDYQRRRAAAALRAVAAGFDPPAEGFTFVGEFLRAGQAEPAAWAPRQIRCRGLLAFTLLARGLADATGDERAASSDAGPPDEAGAAAGAPA